MERDEETRYSDKLEGDTGNYNWPVRFDDNGYIGVDQSGESGELMRVLLSPTQARELVARWREEQKWVVPDKLLDVLPAVLADSSMMHTTKVQ